MSNQKLFPIGNFNSTGISLKLDNENKTIVLYSYINDPKNAEELTFLTSANLTGYVKTSDLTELLSNYLTIESFTEFEESISSEIQLINEAIKNLDISDKLDGYVKFNDLNVVSSNLQGQITGINTELANYATTESVKAINDSLSGYITTGDLAESIKDMATDDEVANAIASALIDNATSGFVMEEINKAISGMATDDEVANAIKNAVSGLATDAKVNDLISAAVSSLVTPENISGFASKTDLEIVSVKVNELSEDVKNIDYTAWEVYPTNKDLAAGEYQQTYIIEGEEVTFTNSTIVDAGMTEQFVVFTNSPAEESDVIIDWGDGSTSSIKNGDYFSVATDDNQEYKIEVAHTYETPNQKYIVKVYGKKYWKLGHIASRGNLMSRVFADDLPVASHLMSLGNFCTRAFRLLYVNIPAYHRVLSIPTWVNCFLECKNLQKVTGFKRIYPLYSVGHLFHGCWNLVETDFKIPTTATDYSYIFTNCQSLNKDITSLFDQQANTLLGFANSTVSFNYAFYGTRSLTGTIPADILWNNQKTKFLGIDACFTNSSLATQAPISWGGTLSDDIIAKPEVEATNDKVDELSGKVSTIETKVTEINNSLTEYATVKELETTSGKLASLINGVDSKFNNYTTTEQITTLENALTKTINTVSSKVNEVSSKFVDYSTTNEVQDLISSKLEDYATTDDVKAVSDKVDVINDSLSGYVKVESLTDYATISYVSSAIVDMATDQELASAIASALIDNATTASVTKQINEAIADMATDQEVSAAIRDAVSGLATDAKVNDLISAAVSSLVTPDNISGFATKTDLENLSNEVNTLTEDVKNIDYTAWEVYPTNKDLAAGEFSDESAEFKNIETISASMTEEFKVTIITTIEDSDVIVDWGDGNQSAIAKGEYTSVGSTNARGECDIIVKHEYTQSKKYIVKVYGRGYCKIIHSKSINNLMCRAFEADLPIASHLKNLWQFAYGAKRLLSVTVGQMHPIVFATNLGGLFQECTNLQKATGFERMYNLWGVGSMFNGCRNLKTTDFKFSPDVYQADNTFLNCLVLERNINEFFQSINNNTLKFKNSYVDFTGTFANCQFLNGTISNSTAKILWNDTETIFKNNSNSTDYTFYNVGIHANSSENEDYTLLNTIPKSWGGLASNNIITKPEVTVVNDKVVELSGKVSTIETKVTEIDNSLSGYAKVDLLKDFVTSSQVSSYVEERLENIDGQQHIFSMTTEELKNANIVENSIYVDKETGAVKVSDNENKLQNISYPVVNTQTIQSVPVDELSSYIPNARTIYDLFNIKFVKVTAVDSSTGEVTVQDDENGTYTVRYK